MKTHKHRSCRISLYNMLHCLTALTGKNFLPCIGHEPLQFQFTPLDSHFHTMHCHGAWLHRLSNLRLGTRGPFSGLSEPSFPQSDQDQIPQLVHIWHVLQFPTILRTLLPFYDKVSVKHSMSQQVLTTLQSHVTVLFIRVQQLLV